MLLVDISEEMPQGAKTEETGQEVERAKKELSPKKCVIARERRTMVGHRVSSPLSVSRQNLLTTPANRVGVKKPRKMGLLRMQWEVSVCDRAQTALASIDPLTRRGFRDSSRRPFAERSRRRRSRGGRDRSTWELCGRCVRTPGSCGCIRRRGRRRRRSRNCWFCDSGSGLPTQKMRRGCRQQTRTFCTGQRSHRRSRPVCRDGISGLSGCRSSSGDKRCNSKRKQRSFFLVSTGACSLTHSLAGRTGDWLRRSRRNSTRVGSQKRRCGT